MSETRRRFDEDFKKNAVRLCKQQAGCRNCARLGYIRRNIVSMAAVNGGLKMQFYVG